MQTDLFFISVLLTSAVTGWLAFYGWRRQALPGARIYAWMALFESLLAFTQILSMISATQDQALFWFKFRYSFSAAIPVLWFFFTLEYNRQKKWLSKWLIGIAFIVPILTQIFIWATVSTGFWVKHEVDLYKSASFWLDQTSSRIPGPWYLVHSFYSLLLLVAGIMVILVAAWKKPRILIGQSILLSTGALITLVTSILPSFNLLPQDMFNPFIPGIGVSAVLYALAVFRFNFLKRSPTLEHSTRSSSFQALEHRSGPIFGLIFILVTAGFAAITYQNYINFSQQFKLQVENQLTSIASLKVDHLHHWRTDRLAIAEYVAKNPILNSLIQTYLENPTNSTAQPDLQTWLDAFALDNQYDRVYFLDKSGNLRISSPTTTEPPDLYLVDRESRFLAGGKIAIVDFYKNSAAGPTFLAIVIPVFALQDHHPLGIFVFRADPRSFLYPFIQDWPVPSASAETLIVRKEGSDVIFLNDLRFQTAAALNLRIPLEKTDNPAVKAVLGLTGIVEGIDYHGQSVIAYISPIQDSPWFLVALIDQAEAFGVLGQRQWDNLLLFGFLTFSAGSGLYFVWRRQRTRFYEVKLIAEGQLQLGEKKLKEAQEMAHFGFWYWDIKTGEVEWSEEVYKIFGLDKNNFKPTIDSILNFTPWPADPERAKEMIRQSIEPHTPGRYEQRFLKPDHSIGYYLSTFQGKFDENGALFSILGSILDITERKRAELALQMSEKKYSTLFNKASIPAMLTHSPNHEIIEVNDACLTLFGYQADEVIGKTSLEIGVNRNQEKRSRTITEFQAQNMVLNLKQVLFSKSGEEITVLTNINSVEIDGEVYAYTTMQDISEVERAEESLRETKEYLENLITYANGPIIIWDSDQKIIRFNLAFAHLTGYLAEEMVGKDLFSVFPDETQATSLLKIAQTSAGEHGHAVEIPIQENQGDTHIVLWNSANIYAKDGKTLVATIAQGQDITDRKKAEATILADQLELHRLVAEGERQLQVLLSVVEDQNQARDEIEKLNSTLEKRVVERTFQLQTSNKELEAFAYSVSHDLRAPLRAIDGYSRILQQEYAKNLDDEGLRLLGIVRDSTKKMDHLITDLLSLSRVGLTELNYSTVDMTPMVKSIYSELATPEVLKKFEFRVSNLPTAPGDQTLIRQVWANLISNAIKYTMPKEKGIIEITGSIKDGFCTYTIKDNGVGFNPDFTNKLFGLFQRLHKAGDFEGTGVGLAIVQRIITRHAGRVSGEGSIGNGATFSFSIPERQVNHE